MNQCDTLPQAAAPNQVGNHHAWHALYRHQQVSYGPLIGGGEGMANRCRVDASLAPEVSDSSLEWPQGMHGA
jgi:hypothetical protein